MRKLMILLLVLFSWALHAQIYVGKFAGLHLQKDAGMYVQGNVDANDNITGEGILYMVGDTIQQLNMDGYTLPNLLIDGKSRVTAASDFGITHGLHLPGTALYLNNNMLDLRETAEVNIHGDAVIFTSSGGKIRKRVNNDIAHYYIPLANQKYRTPVILSSHGWYQDGYIDIMSIPRVSDNKPLAAESDVDNHWKVVSHGIAGEVNATVKLGDDYSRKEVIGYMWQKGAWKPTERTAYGTILVKIPAGESEIFAMKLKTLSLYPNPARENTILTYTSEIAGRHQVFITDARGIIVKVYNAVLIKGANRLTLNLTGLANGFYDVGIKQSGPISTIKLVKQ